MNNNDKSDAGKSDGSELNSDLPEKLEKGFEKLLSPFEDFVNDGVTGSVLLIACALLAMGLANSAWAPAYNHLIHMPIGFFAGEMLFEKSLQHWVNDGLMALFFLVLGLEIKRELLAGELQEVSRSLPVIMAAIGGMLFPALVFYLFNVGEPGLRGWGIPMATDAAFAVGILALLRKHVPIALAAFLTALAIIDDIGAVLVIAVFYTDAIHMSFLYVVIAMFLLLGICNLLGIRHPLVYILAGFVLWLAMLKSGVHASVSGILVALAIPARPAKGPARLSTSIDLILRRLDRRISETDSTDVLEDNLKHRMIERIRNSAKRATTPLQQWGHSLEQPVTLFVLPVFALVNAGISLDMARLPELLRSELMWGISLGLLLGKVVGITTFCWVTLRAGWGVLPAGMNFRHVVGISILAAIGFTMSIFIAGLGFARDPQSLETAKTAILFTSIIAGLLGYAWLRWFTSGKENT